MAYWLVKSEPKEWSWKDHVKKGTWYRNGVRNYQAANNMKGMRLSDSVFFYHSIQDKSIQGIMEVVKEAYPDPKDLSGRFVNVDMQAIKALPQPVTLAAIKAHPTLQHLALVYQPRLSVMPIDEKSWQIICDMANAR